jgi:tetratricopeptide (TPR) repeat protein
MPLIQDLPRQVVPRWRPFVQTHRQEILPVRELVSPRFSDVAVESQLRDWKEHQSSLTIAADLVSVAFTLGLESVATEAAEFVFAHPSAPRPARSLAATYLKREVAELQGEWVLPYEPIGLPEALSKRDRARVAAIHRLRARLCVYPRNPIDWTTLALHYISLGVSEKAERAILVAISLAPENRFVLRAASRFFLHVGQKDRAHKLLVESSLVRVDPWVMAAEIATADAIEKPSTFAKKGKRALEADRFGDQQITELASAIGTLEFKSGNARAGRKLINRSLLKPSENAIAQAAWIARQTHSGLTVVQSTYSAEATAWEAYADGKWDRSSQEAMKWREDQPFSSRPAILGSFLEATIFEDYEKGLEIAEGALRANPGDATLLNNIAYCQIMLGDIESALEHISKVRDGQLSTEESIVTRATKGLIEYRSGRVEAGRALYLEAIKAAQTAGDANREALARTNFAIEEARVNSQGAASACLEARHAARELHTAFGRVLLDLLDRHCGPHTSDPNQTKRASTRKPLPVERPIM